MILKASIKGLEIRPAPLSSFNVQFNVFFGVFPARLSFLPISSIRSVPFFIIVSLCYKLTFLSTNPLFQAPQTSIYIQSSRSNSFFFLSWDHLTTKFLYDISPDINKPLLNVSGPLTLVYLLPNSIDSLLCSQNTSLLSPSPSNGCCSDGTVGSRSRLHLNIPMYDHENMTLLPFLP